MKQKIASCIKSAMSTSCSEMADFTDEPASLVNAEYLLTTNIAKAIGICINFSAGDPYKIYLERQTKIFARDCVPPFKTEIVDSVRPFKTKTLFRKSVLPSALRNGRIDIAIYENGTPICAIEVKGFNPARTLIREDLRRNLIFHRLNENTGDSRLRLSFFCALESRDKRKSEQCNLASVEDKYRRWQAELGDLFDIRYTVEIFTVSRDVFGRGVPEDDYVVLDRASRHHFIGTVICIETR